MIKTPLSTVIGGAFWTPGATVIGGQQSFSQLIKKLFSNGEQGFFYDPNDLSTMYQDVAGTIPVTAQGQPVGLMKDKSGRNNHAYQSVSASRPILQHNATTGAYYLAFDGSDDFLQTSNIDFTVTDKMSLFAGVRKLSDAAIGMVAELSVSSFSSAGTFSLRVPQTAGAANVGSYSRGTVQVSPAAAVSGLVAPVSVYLSAKMSISTNLNVIRANGVTSSLPDNQGAGKYGNHPLYIGRRAGTTFPFNGHLYGLIGIGKVASDTETAAIEKELAKQVGVTLNV